MYQVLVVVCTLLLASCFGQLPSSGDDRCNIFPHLMEKCGEDGITESECSAQDCCFIHKTLPGIPQCHKKRPVSCTVFPMARRQCGDSSLSELACKARGCCYEQGLPHIPSCFHKD